MNRPQNFALHIRVPTWAEGMTMTHNGIPVKLSIQPGNWATLDRHWEDGDRIIVKIQWNLRQVPVDRQHTDRVALVYGPVVLVEQQKTALVAGLSNIKQNRAATSMLRFSSTRAESSFVPFYSISFGQPYAMYVDI
jgi:DUF1680 family protein